MKENRTLVGRLAPQITLDEIVRMPDAAAPRGHVREGPCGCGAKHHPELRGPRHGAKARPRPGTAPNARPWRLAP